MILKGVTSTEKMLENILKEELNSLAKAEEVIGRFVETIENAHDFVGDSRLKY